jgi:hypothetical protein
LEERKNARGVEQARLLHVSQVDDIIARGAKESGTVEPPFAVVEGTLGENIAISHVDASLLSGGFEKPDVRCPDQPALLDRLADDEPAKTLEPREARVMIDAAEALRLGSAIDEALKPCVWSARWAGRRLVRRSASNRR